MSVPSTEPLFAGDPEGEGSGLPGPYPVGRYAERLREQLRSFTRVQLTGEIANLRPPTRARAYFELRDADGALPCAMWRTDWERLGALTDSLADGMEVVVAGGCDYYPGSASASPAFSFAVSELRVAGEGDLLVQIEERRRALAADGLLERQLALRRPVLPRTIGIVCGERAKAGDDLIAALERRSWRGRVVWAFAPVQDRHAAPRVAGAVRDLAATGVVDVIVVTRGGGSLTDLLAFSDEALCRTVALLAVPVIASIGHHTDRTLLDEVAAASCSTPTHAAEVAVSLDCKEAGSLLAATARRLRRHSSGAVVERARVLAGLSRAPTEHVARHRRGLHRQAQELAAASDRRLAGGRAALLRDAGQLARRHEGALREMLVRRPAELERLAIALSAHDPERTLARGYALVEDPAGEPLASAAAARAQGDVRLRFADGRLAARIAEDDR
ncbi:MAG TPA: exodeoxyribonuclease VII large subunit [Solirubrobacteraceae bacterium]|nr:exodeoxyribonuclease VII large subunit [Solirubrobacteraceae bacterium]